MNKIVLKKLKKFSKEVIDLDLINSLFKSEINISEEDIKKRK